jgi:hypothetical protein
MCPEIFRSEWFIVLIIVLSLWDSVWKLIGLWRSARNNQLGWFICIAVINTLGILPIIYVMQDKKRKSSDTKEL